MLIAFDFDGTLSDSEMTVLLGEQAGVAEEIDGITRRAMNDELSYAESLYARAELLDGLPEADAEAAFERVQLRPGAADVVAVLRETGHHVAVLTGGFEAGVERALSAEGVDVDTVVANRLPVRNGKLTGEARGPLIEGTKDDSARSTPASKPPVRTATWWPASRSAATISAAPGRNSTRSKAASASASGSPSSSSARA